MKRTLVGVIILTMCLLLCACGNTPVPTETPTAAPTEAPTEPPEPTISPEELERQAAYHEKMAAALDDVDHDQVKERNVTKAVALVKQKYDYENKGTYVDTYVDPKRVAENPEEVRFIVRCRFFDVDVGYYEAGGGTAHKHCVEVDVIDLSWGSSPRVEAKVFSGGDPPETVSEYGKHYGPGIDPKVIIEWSESVIIDLLKK